MSDSEAFRMVEQIRGLLAEARRDAGTEAISQIFIEGIETAKSLAGKFIEAEHESRKEWHPEQPYLREMNLLSNLRSLTDLAERLYPDTPRLAGVAKVRALLKDEDRP